MLNKAANCYKRSLELEANEKHKNNLNRRIGNVYNEITSGYIEEIASEFVINMLYTHSCLVDAYLALFL